jgi:hypothetical protein
MSPTRWQCAAAKFITNVTSHRYSECGGIGTRLSKPQHTNPRWCGHDAAQRENAIQQRGMGGSGNRATRTEFSQEGSLADQTKRRVFIVNRGERELRRAVTGAGL